MGSRKNVSQQHFRRTYSDTNFNFNFKPLIKDTRRPHSADGIGQNRHFTQISANFSLDLDSKYKTDNSQLFSVRLKNNTNLCNKSVPIMMLPPARPRITSDFTTFVRNSRLEVIPLDLRSPIILSGVSTSVTVETRPSDIPEGKLRDFNNKHANYLDNFADFQPTKVKFRNNFLEKTLGDELQDMINEISCPSCLRILQSFTSVQDYLKFLEDLLIISKGGIQILPRHNYVRRGRVPHFCNFVKKLPLQERDTTSPKPSHSHGKREAGNKDTSRPASHVTTHIGDASERSGHEARPASPASQIDGPDSSKDSIDFELPPSPVPVIRVSTPDEPEPEDDQSVEIFVKEEDTVPKEPVIEIPTEDTKPKNDVPPKKAAIVWQDPAAKVTSKSAVEAKPKTPTPPPSKPPSPKPPTSSKKSKSHTTIGKSDTDKPKKSRSCVVKKERKTSEPKRKSKVEPPKMEEEKETKPDTPPPPSEPVAENREPSPPPLPELPVPDLPEVKIEPKEPASQKPKPAPAKSFLEAFVAPTIKDREPVETQDSEVKPKPYEFPSNLPPEPDLKPPSSTKRRKPKGQSWLQGRLALSQQASRFELPMDMKTLETMSPEDYLTKFCIISSRRQTLYQKVFMKYKDGKLGKLTLRDLEKALRDVLINTITAKEVKYMCELVQLNDESLINLKLFSGLAAMAERVLYPKFLREIKGLANPESLTEDTIDMPEYKKDKIECADFCALDWKFHGVNVNPPVKKILEAL